MSGATASVERDRPKVSVCLLAYNHERLLEQTVRTVLAQNLRDFELIISDDQSPDGTWPLIQRLASDDARIRAVQTPRNLGMPGNANFAASQASSDYIALLHHDDLYAPNLLSRWLDVAQRYPSVGFVSNAYAMHESSRVDFHPFDECHDGRDALERILLPSWGCPVRGTALIRKQCWDAVGGMRERFGLLADVDLWMRLAACYDVGYVREPLITTRQDRPEDYPDEYTKWTWSRMRLMFEIHGTAREEYFGLGSAKLKSEMHRFRRRVSAHEAYWFAYAVAKRRWDILASSSEIANPYETRSVRVLRKALAALT